MHGIEYSSDGRVLLRALDDFSGDIVVPQNVVTIGTSSEHVGSPFYKCKDKLRSLTFFPSSQVQSICSFCFCESSLEIVDMQHCTLLTILNNSVFKLCKKLQTITLPPKIVEIKSGCFNYVPLSSISIPDSLETIGDWTSVDGGVFTGSLSSISINPTSRLKKIGSAAFENARITSIYIPKNVSELTAVSFVNAPLETIEIDPENKNFKADGLSIFSGSNNNTLVYVSKQFKGEYVVPNFVTKIAGHAFRCGQLTSIKIHSEVTSISYWAFGNSNLVDIVLPEKVLFISSSLFQSCSRLRSVKISNSTTTIQSMAFYLCTSLTSISFPQTLTNIGESAFYGCKSLVIDSSQNTNFNYINQMLLTNQKTTISEFFGDDSNLEIIAPLETTAVGSRTFMNKHFKTIKFQGNVLTRIGDWCFSSSTIQSISFPDSLRTLGTSCFDSCQSLTSVSFSSTCPITEIPSKCFYNCINLQILTLPSSITALRSNAFYNCIKISDIGLSNTRVSIIENFCFMNSGITSISSSSTIVLGYCSFTNSNIAEVNLHTDNIPEECFKNCISLTSLTLNEGLTSISDSAFRSCVSLSSFNIPSSLKIIRFYAFMSCSMLKTVTLSLHSSIREINGGTFANCSLLQSIILDPDDKDFKFTNGALTFYNETEIITFIPNSNIQTFVVPSAMEKIASYSFYNCINLVRVIFSGSRISAIDYMAFYGCAKLSYIFLGTNTQVTSIGSKAFEGCSLLNRCGSITCPSATIPLFVQQNIPMTAFRTDCDYFCQSLNKVRSSFISPISLITPFILM